MGGAWSRLRPMPFVFIAPTQHCHDPRVSSASNLGPELQTCSFTRSLPKAVLVLTVRDGPNRQAEPWVRAVGGAEEKRPSPLVALQWVPLRAGRGRLRVQAGDTSVKERRCGHERFGFGNGLLMLCRSARSGSLAPPCNRKVPEYRGFSDLSRGQFHAWEYLTRPHHDSTRGAGKHPKRRNGIHSDSCQCLRATQGIHKMARHLGSCSCGHLRVGSPDAVSSNTLNYGCF
ncbi:hypothetical protein VUR80DRAFT_1544 [Thermomyces stellatus]